MDERMDKVFFVFKFFCKRNPTAGFVLSFITVTLQNRVYFNSIKKQCNTIHKFLYQIFYWFCSYTFRSFFASAQVLSLLFFLKMTVVQCCVSRLGGQLFVKRTSVSGSVGDVRFRNGRITARPFQCIHSVVLMRAASLSLPLPLFVTVTISREALVSA